MKRLVFGLFFIIVSIIGVGLIIPIHHTPPHINKPSAIEVQYHFSNDEIYIIKNLAYKLQRLNENAGINVKNTSPSILKDLRYELDIQMVALYNVYMNIAITTNATMQSVVKLDEEKITIIDPIYLSTSEAVMGLVCHRGVLDITGGATVFCLAKDSLQFSEHFKHNYPNLCLKPTLVIFPIQFWIVEKNPSKPII